MDVANGALPAYVVTLLFFVGLLIRSDNEPAYWHWQVPACLLLFFLPAVFPFDLHFLQISTGHLIRSDSKPYYCTPVGA